MQEQAGKSAFKEYMLFWSGQLISLLGSSIAQFVIIWWITLETKSALYLSLASLLGVAPMVIVAPFAGVLVDRWNRKILIAVVDFLQSLAVIVLVFLFWLNIVAIWQILALLALRGVLQAFHYPAVSALVPLMVPKEKLSRMNGLNFLFNGAVTLVGPIAAAVLLGFWQIHQILWIDVATFVVALVPLLIVRIPSVRMKQERSSFKKEFSEGFGFIKNARGLLTLMILSTALNFLVTPLSTLIPYFVKFDHLGGASELALIMASFEGGILGGGAVMSVVKVSKKKMIISLICLYIAFLGYALVAITPTGLFWFMALSAVFMAFCIPIVNVLFQTIEQTIIPPQIFGRVNSVSMALGMGATPLGMILSGTIVGLTGTVNLFLGSALSGMLILTVSWFFTDLRQIEKMEESPAIPAVD
jgi:DHA3 family macrolide efflux protein-like MFS transporter